MLEFIVYPLQKTDYPDNSTLNSQSSYIFSLYYKEVRQLRRLSSLFGQKLLIHLGNCYYQQSLSSLVCFSNQVMSSVVVLHASHCLSPSLIQILIAIQWLSSAVPYLPFINKLSQLPCSVFAYRLYARYHTENTRKVMGKILVTGKRLNLGVRGHDQVVPGVAMHPGQES